ncbi:radical SAM protein [Micromonospora rubida]|uniref:radical SAM protein n=1 Tax=Micromonospora rubida TaxID=2697657 RepID=UPI00137906F2|nr:radical SAM protein [Micromonospora rubida]NBE79608.1 radical SAM protein [Micromonospora rubida]
MHVPTADIYVTYRCNMRCRHCFVGSALDRETDLPRDALIGFLRTAWSDWSTREISLLGGEPTLYPDIDLAIRAGREIGFQVRVVSNGGPALLRMMGRHDTTDFGIAVSVDAASPDRHDAIRRPGSLRSALRCVAAAREQGRPVSAILSVGRHNLDQAVATLRLLGGLGVDHVNVHYVTDRGFASAEMLVGVPEWLRLRDEIAATPGLPPVRFEGTFQPAGRPLVCAAEQESMLMLFPDLRVYSCSMYLGLPHGNAFRWSGRALVRNARFDARYGSPVPGVRHCPASRFVNASLPRSAESVGRTVGCIFDKELLNAGPAGSTVASRTTDRREL